MASKRSILRFDPVQIIGNIGLVTLTRGLFATIDAADAHLVEGRNWNVQASVHTNYAISRERGTSRQILMHRLLLSAPDGVIVDHEDRDGLNNRRRNIRFATRSFNGHNSKMVQTNTSGAKGVYWNKREKRWSAQIIVENKRHLLGYFVNFDDAVAARAAAFMTLVKEPR